MTLCPSYTEFEQNLMLPVACRTGVTFVVFQGNRGESEASRELRARGGFFLAILPSHATRASRSPRFCLCLPEIRKKSRLFCRLCCQGRCQT